MSGSFRNAATPIDGAPPTGRPATDGWFSQFGTHYFRAKPRFEELDPPEFDISVVNGRLTVEQTVMAALGRPARPNHRVRHFRIPELLRAGYACLHTPRAKRPDHGSILASCLSSALIEHKVWWFNSDRIDLDELAS